MAAGQHGVTVMVTEVIDQRMDDLGTCVRNWECRNRATHRASFLVHRMVHASRTPVPLGVFVCACIQMIVCKIHEMMIYISFASVFAI
jgi:hypothetical protein